MCHYQETCEKKECYWEEYYNKHIDQEKHDIVNTALPIDVNGFCLFHSPDIKWKRKQHFCKRLKALLNWAEEDSDIEDISFTDFIFIGCQSIETIDNNVWDQHENKLDTKKKDILLLDFLKGKKNLILQDSKFIDPLIIENATLAQDLIIDHCVFEDSISINKLIIKSDLFIQYSEFKKHFIWDGKNKIKGNTSILDNKFKGRINFWGLIFENFVVIDNNIFNKSDYVTGFTCSFKEGLDFTRNKFTDIYFDGCCFMKDCTFAELHQQYHSFTIRKPSIQGQLSFVGTSDNLLFNTNSRIHISKECFHDTGRVSFDYCNIESLGTIFIENIKSLEDLGLAYISPTCQIERLTIIHEYKPYTSLTANIIEDFAHLIARYFSRWHTVNLMVRINRDKANQRFLLVFKTTDNLSEDEFRDIMKRFHHTMYQHIPSKDDEIKDIIATYYNIVERLSKNSNIIGIENIKRILSMQNTINIETLNINTAQMEIKNSQIGAIAMGDNAHFENILVEKTNLESNYQSLIDELNGLIRLLQREHKDCENIIAQLQKAIEAAKQKKDTVLKETLKKLPHWVVKTTHNIGVGVLSSYISQILGI